MFAGERSLAKKQVFLLADFSKSRKYGKLCMVYKLKALEILA